MKSKLAVVYLTACSLIGACGDKEKTTTQQRVKDLSAEMDQKAKDMKNELADTRENYTNIMETQLKALQLKVDALVNDVDQLKQLPDSDQVKALRESAEARLEKADDQYAVLEEKFDAFKDDTKDDWKERRTALNELYDDTKSNIETSLDRNKAELEVKEKLDKISAKLVELRADAANAKDEAKAKLEADIAKLEEKNNELADKFADFRASSKEKWETLKDDMNKTFKDLGTTFKNLFN